MQTYAREGSGGKGLLFLTSELHAGARTISFSSVCISIKDDMVPTVYVAG